MLVPGADLVLLHRKLAGSIRYRADFHGVAGFCCDIRVGDQVYVKQPMAAISSTKKVHFGKATAPAFQPQDQFLTLAVGSCEML